MSHGDEPSLREQLVDARANIVAQLDKMYSPVTRSAAGPPDFRELIAELEGQLSEIDALLGVAEETPHPGTYGT